MPPEAPSPAPSRSVLVLDGDWVSALAIVRSLGRKGLRVDVAAATARCLASRSRYCRDAFVYPDPMGDVPGFRDWLAGRLHDTAYDLVIPVTDKTIVPLMEVRDTIEQSAPLAMAKNVAIQTTLSKNATTELADTLGIPTPRSRIVREPAEVEDVLEEMSFPLVLKPDSSKVWTDYGEAQDLSVTYARDPRELSEKLSVLLPSGPVLLQEKVRGQGVGLGVLASAGEVLFLFQYRRLHEVPLTGGASSYRVAERVDPRLRGFAEGLVGALAWDGVAMLEFKQDPGTGKTWLIEVNGRFWGSLPLPVAAGADFPSYLYDLRVDGRRDFPPSYREGLRCRSERRDARWLVDVLAARRRGDAVAPGLGRLAADGLRVLSPFERWDTLSLADPGPGVAEIAGLAGKAFRRVGSKLRQAAARRRMRRVRDDPATLQERLRRARNVLMLCRGNIMRSPFAEACVARSRVPGLELRSAGLEAWSGKPADPMAIAEARRRDVDLVPHRASPLTAELAAWADVIFAMETAHLVAIADRFPEAVDKSFLLTCLETSVPLEIADPLHGDGETFVRCFDLIESAAAPIAEALQRSDR